MKLSVLRPDSPRQSRMADPPAGLNLNSGFQRYHFQTVSGLSGPLECRDYRSTLCRAVTEIELNNDC